MLLTRPASRFELYRELLGQAWPLVTALAGETLLGIVDTKLVAGLGPASLSGVGMATTLMWLAYSIALGLSRGVKVRVAHAVGEGRVADAPTYAMGGAIIAAFYGLLVFAIGRDLSWLFATAGVDKAAIGPARDFFAAITWGAPGACVAMALVQYRQGIRDPRTPMIITLFGNALNAFFGYALIYGKFGFPALGVRGGGAATAAVQTLNALILIVLLVRDVRPLRGVAGQKSSLGGSLSLANASKEVARLGLPTGAHFFGETLAFTAFTLILGGISAMESAANQIALTTMRASFLPGFALGEAACVLVGQSLGAKKPAAAKTAVKAALHLAVSFMFLCGVVFAIFGTAIGSAFTSDRGVAVTVGRLLLFAAAFQILDAINIVYRCALRGAEDVRIPAIAGILIMWTTVPVAAYVLGQRLRWGALGGWCGFLGETVLGATFFAFRFRKIMKRLESNDEIAPSAPLSVPSSSTA